MFGEYRKLLAFSVRIVINSDLATGSKEFLTTRLSKDINTLKIYIFLKISPINRILCNCFLRRYKESYFTLSWDLFGTIFCFVDSHKKSEQGWYWGLQCMYWVGQKVHSSFYIPSYRKDPKELFGQPNTLPWNYHR